jgi:capsular exopolysaccharide synthesis family protein
MSRFFETLKEASRSQLVSGAAPPPDKRASEPTKGFPIPDIGEASAILSMPEVSPADFMKGVPQPPLAFSGKTISISLGRTVPLIPHAVDKGVVEQYGRLRTKIQQQHATSPIRSLLIASPGPSEGKTITTINLGLSFAMLPDTRVLVIDGDLRRGTIGNWLGVSDLPGFSEVIEGSTRLEDAIFKAEDLPLHFMFGGNSKMSPAELLNSHALPEIIRRLTGQFELVLVDSPPVNLIADAQMLASSCDGVLLVARAFKTTGKAFQKMLRDLLPFRIVGTVLNGGMRTQRYSYYGY